MTLVTPNPGTFRKGDKGRIPDFIVKGISKPSFGPGRFIKAGRFVKAFIKRNPRLVGTGAGIGIGNVINEGLTDTGIGTPFYKRPQSGPISKARYRRRRRYNYNSRRSSTRCHCTPKTSHICSY